MEKLLNKNLRSPYLVETKTRFSSGYGTTPHTNYKNSTSNYK